MVYHDTTPHAVVDHPHTTWSDIQDKLYDWFDTALLNLPNFLLAVVVFICFVCIAIFSSNWIGKILLKTRIQASVRIVSLRIYKAIIILIGFFVALGILNLSTVLTSVLGAAGVAGIAVGLALQGTLSNTFSGVALSIMPKIQIGDWIRTTQYEGFVTDINLRNITLKTADQNIVCIPNNKMVDNPFKNLSADPRGIAILECGVGYESDLEFVEGITIKAVEEAIPQKKDEKVELFYKEFADSAIKYEIRFWIKELNAKDEIIAKHKAIKAIKKAYNIHHINIPFPIRTVDLINSKKEIQNPK